MQVVTSVDDGPVRSIIIDNPPVNATSAEVRRNLSRLIEEADRCPETQAIVIACAGKTFVAGADIKEFGKPPVDLHLSEVIGAIEACSKPVVAAIQGTALGGGFELAMGCHYRVAHAGASFGLPESTLGIVPGAGGIPRLARLAGIPTTIDMVTSGKRVRAKEGLELGFVDEIAADDDVHLSAKQFARALFEQNAGPRRTGARSITLPMEGYFEEARARAQATHRGQEAPQVCIDIAEAAASTSLDEGVAYGRKRFQERVNSDQARALRHAFFAERVATRPEGVPKTESTVAQAGVVGAGTMGTGIAMCFLNAGIPVVLVDNDVAVLEKSRNIIQATYEKDLARRRISPGQKEARLAALTIASAFDALKGCDLVVEAVFEDLAIKHQVIAQIEQAVDDHAVIASNTSYLNIDALADQAARPQNIVGMHFFSPAHIMKLLENVRGRQSSPQALATIQDVGKRLGKIAVMVKVADGFVGNRMLARRTRECYFMLEEGALPEQIDRVLYEFGFPMGQFQLNDLAGLDVAWRNRQGRLVTLTPRERENNILDEIVALGRLGQKSGAGFYRYDEARKRSVDPEITRLIIKNSEVRGIQRRTITDQEILERCLYAMINEGAKILEEGIASRPEEIDTIWLNGYGFPRYRGGPMFYADQIGLAAIHDRLVHYAKRFGDEYWTPSPLLEKLAGADGTFYPR